MKKNLTGPQIRILKEQLCLLIFWLRSHLESPLKMLLYESAHFPLIHAIFFLYNIYIFMYCVKFEALIYFIYNVVEVGEVKYLCNFCLILKIEVTIFFSQVVCFIYFFIFYF